MFRIEPNLPPQAFKTYQILAPVQTHFRKAKNCAECKCPNHLKGWRTVIDESTEQGQRQAFYIRKSSGRKFTEQKDGAGLTEFVFEPGQNCFALSDHRVRLDREERYFIRSGDHRWSSNPTELRRSDWQESFADHQDKLKTQSERG